MDGSRILTVLQDGMLEQWDAETLQLIVSWRGHERKVSAADYNPKGDRIVTASDDCTAKEWDADTLQLLGTMSGGQEKRERVYSAVYSPDSRRIVTISGERTVQVWDALTFKCLNAICIIPGIKVMGVVLCNLHPDLIFSDGSRELLYRYGAIVNKHI